MTNFCTLFDHNYLSRGLTLFESLKNHCKEPFKLFVLATDDIAYNWLTENSENQMHVSSMAEIKSNYPILLKLEEERSRAEFNWTLSSFSIQFFLKKFNLENITYLDADLCFYDDPNILFSELNENESVIITPHNYTPVYDQSKTSGRYCVQFMYFKNNDDGNKVLEWWRNECEKCCCSTPKDGKFGDQKYLDDWLSRFPVIVHEEKHIGCGIAPWNVQQFDIEQKDNGFILTNKITKVKDKLIFYHFHGLKEQINNEGSLIWKLNTYELSDFVVENLYKPYTRKLESLVKTLPKQELQYAKKLVTKISLSTLLFKTAKRSVKYFLKAFLFFKTMKEIKKESVDSLSREKYLIN